MKRVTGIGGIFFKAVDPQKLKTWYEQYLGITGMFLWGYVDNPPKPGYTVWNAFSKTSKLFEPGKKDYVFNYRVDDLVALLKALKKEGVTIIGEMESDEEGKFAHVMDLEENKIVLWEASDKFTKVTASKPDRVTGLGGIFFKTNDKEKLKEWYDVHLGLKMTQWGCTFLWIDPNDPKAKVPARTEWSPFPSDTAYFQPSQKEFMFNYRVKDLVGLLKVLKSEGVEIAGEMEEYPYGKFGWIMDPEKNKIELWEPKDDGF